MFSKLIILAASVSVLSFACNTNKKTTKKDSIANEPAIQLDTIMVSSNETPKRQVYRESNPISFDLIHTRLDVNFDWTHCYMNGKATIQLKPHFYPSNLLYLDARGMDIKEISLLTNGTNKTSLKYLYERDSLKITLDKIYTNKETLAVYIDYVSKPNELKSGGSAAINSDKGLYFINPAGLDVYKMPQIWTQGETQSNSAWFPTIDSPNQKMTQEIFMTVENQFTTLSNGLLVDSKKHNDSTRTDHWKMDLPHAPYLAMMAVGRFKKVVDEPWNGKEISYYVEKEYEPHAKAIFGDTKEMIEFYSSKLGVPYAWPKYAQIAVRDYVSGAMENTSATLHGDFTVYQTTRETLDSKKGNSIIAHELFHQWFGDLVTSESWSNLPLNESFATYGEYLWEEYKFGRDAADYHHYQSRQGYKGSDKEVNLVRFNYENREDMFDAFSYNKGGQVLHMLRKAVGDDAFFASLKNYLETNKFKTGEIHQLRLAFEQTTGKDMNWFFNQWFLNNGRPKITVTQNYNVSQGTVELTVEQNQDFKKVPLYTLPIDIDIYVNGKAERTRIVVTEQKQTFIIKTSGAPQLVNFDAERQLLCDLDYKKSQEEYIFQYKNAPLYEDRFEAIKELEKNLSDVNVYNVIKWAAENDKYFVVRNHCISQLDKAPTEKLAEVKSTLLTIYNNDKKTLTRARALNVLNKKFLNDADIKSLNEKALNEMSYAICAEALDYFGKIDVKIAMQKAKAFENENGKDVLYTIAELYANYGSDEQIGFYRSNLKNVNGFEMMSYISYYAKCAKRCNNSVSALIAAQDFETIAKAGNKFTKFGAQKSLKDLMVIWEQKEKTAKASNAAEKDVKLITETKEIITKQYNNVK
ncbi:MAG: M1 family metallopeptidase [Bacteroidota bacterium]|nr:M1 family metallopeptidase [Bacteroidota bacterium]